MMRCRINLPKLQKIYSQNSKFLAKIKFTKIFQEILGSKNGQNSLLKNKQIFMQGNFAVFAPIYAEIPKNKYYLAKKCGE